MVAVVAVVMVASTTALVVVVAVVECLPLDLRRDPLLDMAVAEVTMIVAMAVAMAEAMAEAMAVAMVVAMVAMAVATTRTDPMMVVEEEEGPTTGEGSMSRDLTVSIERLLDGHVINFFVNVSNPHLCTLHHACRSRAIPQLKVRASAMSNDRIS